MRLLAAGCVLLAFAGIAAAQDDDPMAPRYGNTLIVKNAEGQEARMFYNADHTYTGTMMDSAVVKGVWVLAEGKLCVEQIEPKPPANIPNPRCRKFEMHNVGDTWEIDTPNGKITASIVSGR